MKSGVSMPCTAQNESHGPTEQRNSATGADRGNVQGKKRRSFGISTSVRTVKRTPRTFERITGSSPSLIPAERTTIQRKHV
ncbi:MAG: hypothetical protein U0166_17890 [Acidobacteriota bacterium]